MLAKPIETYEIMFSVGLDQIVPEDADVICLDEDGQYVWCVQRFQIIDKPNRAFRGKLATSKAVYSVSLSEFKGLMSFAQKVEPDNG